MKIISDIVGRSRRRIMVIRACFVMWSRGERNMLTDFLSTTSALSRAEDWARFDKFLSLTETMLNIPGLDEVVLGAARSVSDAASKIDPPPQNKGQ